MQEIRLVDECVKKKKKASILVQCQFEKIIAEQSDHVEDVRRNEVNGNRGSLSDEKQDRSLFLSLLVLSFETQRRALDFCYQQNGRSS